MGIGFQWRRILMDIQKFNIIDNNLLFNDIDNELELEWEKFFDESTTVF